MDLFFPSQIFPAFCARGFFTLPRIVELARILALQAGHLKVQPKRGMLGHPTIEGSIKKGLPDSWPRACICMQTKGSSACTAIKVVLDTRSLHRGDSRQHIPTIPVRQAPKMIKRHAAPVAAEAIDPTELAYAHAWGYTAWQWQALTVSERRVCRDRVVFAPNFQTAG